MDDLNLVKTNAFLDVLVKGRVFGPMELERAVSAALVMDIVKHKCDPNTIHISRTLFMNVFDAANFLGLSMPSQDEKELFNLYHVMPDEFNWEALYERCSRLGEMSVTKALVNLMVSGISNSPKNILIAEGLKFVTSLKDFVGTFKNSNIYITCESTWQSRLIEKLLPGSETDFSYGVVDGYEKHNDFVSNNVKIVRTSIYRPDFIDSKFDLIIASPAFGVRQHLLDVENSKMFISRLLSDVAVENLMYHTQQDGLLKIILPQGFLFQYGRTEVLREMIANKYCVQKIVDLPAGMFRPYAGVNTLFLSLKNGEKTDKVIVERYVDADKTTKKLRIEELALEKSVDTDIKQINVNGAWNIAQFFSKDETPVMKYNSDETGKAKLGDVALVFRGKNVSQKDEGGKYGVINIGNIGEYDLVKWDTLQRIDDEERKVKNYILEEGDILIPARGSAVRCVVFHKQDFECIASANVIVIRPKDNNILDADYLKIFFDSEIGKALVTSTQSGAAIMNVSYKQLQSIMVPTPNIEVQRNIAAKYLTELKLYQKRINKATERWNSVLAEVQKY